MARLTQAERAVHAARVAARQSADYAAVLAREVERSAAQLAAMTKAHESTKARAERARLAAERDQAALDNLINTAATEI